MILIGATQCIYRVARSETLYILHVSNENKTHVTVNGRDISCAWWRVVALPDRVRRRSDGARAETASLRRGSEPLWIEKLILHNKATCSLVHGRFCPKSWTAFYCPAVGTKPISAYENVRISYLIIAVNLLICFGHLLWPSSGRCFFFQRYVTNITKPITYLTMDTQDGRNM